MLRKHADISQKANMT
uniref:Uncharacterized protein n=1 Tax=Rhizophora mucronata TaxID=61149 RepID=A0A2P2J4V2_RHIMU